jgi:hypothetical protein
VSCSNSLLFLHLTTDVLAGSFNAGPRRCSHSHFSAFAFGANSLLS